MLYRVGLPFWKFVARRSGEVGFRVEVMYDRDAKVFMAYSSDLHGFVVEAATVDELVRRANDVAEMLLEEYLQGARVRPRAIYKDLDTAIASV